LALAAFSVAVVVAVAPATASGTFANSPLLESIPAAGACDVVITPANAAITLEQLDDPTKRVFCVDPGDYRVHGVLWLTRSGTQAKRRFLRFNASGDQTAVQRSQRARFENIHVFGNWWVIQGLTIQPAVRLLPGSLRPCLTECCLSDLARNAAQNPYAQSPAR
jgi:hypothetical protein